MQIAAHDVGRLSRILAGCAGGAVALYGAFAATPLATGPAMALVPAGLALLCCVLPTRAVRRTAYGLGAAAAILGAARLGQEPAAAVATMLAGLALALIDVRLPLRPGRPARHRAADPLLAGSAVIALVALVPRMFAPTFPGGPGPDGVMSPYTAGAVLTLALGGILARPEAGPLRTGARAGPATMVRRFFPTLVAVPVIAALTSALLVRTGISRPAAAISTGTVLAVLAVLGFVGALVRSLEAMDRRQRALLADRRRAEEQLGEHAAGLERGNVALREANTRLEAALAFKNDLTSMLTHDVAQPISSIASLAELLSEDWADLPEDIRRELACKIDKNTRRLIKMMNDLQLLFELDTGAVTARRTPVPLREVVQSVIASAGAEDDVRVAVGDDLSALADRGHVGVVVRNLLANAVAYGEAPVEICAARTHDTVTLIVSDHGPGIADDLLPRLFDRFMGGAGLGLFIVRHLVEANGGAVRYEPGTPRGARLIVTLEAASVSG
ncbi:sensor histidine kinase [Mangrovihabitans endophyticus]|uniref:Sensor-like histidine kinase SenX3 n=1 Tax=Mangrovihabitans endophyticus TaxID=1751298 RepID=A0A8J3BXZ3_9ACTN|nr:HAMP domain-containing sensor histidine kinase [Mangrovihabitans endophyticus]GGK83053.1 hypothetical protein GCM10012284_16480 [Mangrovihabitans endophyticus]